jgi:hypothetical protein
MTTTNSKIALLLGLVAALLAGLAAPARAQTAVAEKKPAQEPEKKATGTRPLTVDLRLGWTFALTPAVESDFWPHGLAFRLALPARSSNEHGEECMKGDREHRSVGITAGASFREFLDGQYREQRLNGEAGMIRGEAMWTADVGFFGRFKPLDVVAFEGWLGLGLNAGAEVRARRDDDPDELHRIDRPWGIGPAMGLSALIYLGPLHFQFGATGLMFDDTVALDPGAMVGVQL